MKKYNFNLEVLRGLHNTKYKYYDEWNNAYDALGKLCIVIGHDKSELGSNLEIYSTLLTTNEDFNLVYTILQINDAGQYDKAMSKLLTLCLDKGIVENEEDLRNFIKKDSNPYRSFFSYSATSWTIPSYNNTLTNQGIDNTLTTTV